MSIRVAVIGAGAAGLCAVRHLASRPSTFSVTAFEQCAEVGGTWIYTEKIGTDDNGLLIHSSMYRNLKTNLPKEVMAFPDYPFDKTLPSFVEHHEVLRYLKDYAAHFNLLHHIKFETQVIEVKPIHCPKEQSQTGHAQKWLVTTAPAFNTEQTVSDEFDAVIVCNGHYAMPLIPEIPGLDTFPGEILHSHDYRVPEDFRNKTILCLGASSSGQDICIDLSKEAKQVYLCHNKPLMTTELPLNVQQKPGIQSICGSTVIVKNGDELHVDSLLFCTGYHYSFPFLSAECHMHTEGERVTPLYKHLIHTELPTLSFIGICKVIVPFPMFHFQVLLVLAILDGTHQLPSKKEMDADTEADFKGRLADGLPRRYAHHMGGRQWQYNDELAQIAKCKPIQRSVQHLFDYVHKARMKHLLSYKEERFQPIEEENDC